MWRAVDENVHVLVYGTLVCNHGIYVSHDQRLSRLEVEGRCSQAFAAHCCSRRHWWPGSAVALGRWRCRWSTLKNVIGSAAAPGSQRHFDALHPRTKGSEEVGLHGVSLPHQGWNASQKLLAVLLPGGASRTRRRRTLAQSLPWERMSRARPTISLGHLNSYGHRVNNDGPKNKSRVQCDR